ncbi:Magnesium-protoporphyrin O-methyltransferase [Corynebacterium occultum]|uniref:Magnesium-protoporphyrin O-methyltransferase n=1 Tax=Corynebacterium occultum TaxID=2675219 RepID=A0A6B8W7R9_9CORY|nr:class I SAM-dependent methyltransferase [Corynebacterium occultum]QGU07345.1 Magnesium-protoporphyrin O-methyltransferase [Corynebacterium occultum]
MATWREIVATDPSHSENYAARWKRMAAEGMDINGEARLIDAMVDRGARILDAGCGTGRLGGYLARQGHTVIGTDLDPILIRHARNDYPEARWEVGDLGRDELPEGNFDMIVSAGNVMGFLAEEDRESALANIQRALGEEGRVVIGFGAGRGWGFDDFIATARTVGMELENVFESWDLKPFREGSQFLVAFFSRV